MCSEQIDVLFRAFPVSDPLRFRLDRQICFVPDLQHEEYPAFFTSAELVRRREDFRRLIEGCGAVATLSEHSRTIICREYRNRYDDIFTLPGANQFATELSPVYGDKISAIKLPIPYFYYPAKLWPHKNHEMLLKAFALFRSSAKAHEDFTLVLSGDPSGWPRLKASSDSTNVVHMGFVPDNEVALLFRNATALVFPSLFEGFGMPVLEAFGFGCPVISSNAASLPELADDAAILVDPHSAEELARAMAAIADDKALRVSLIAKGTERLQFYSWEKSASILREAFERVQERNVLVETTEPPPLVSIVTPSFNQGRFIARTIESVFSQTYPNIEYRVVDGGSTDSTLEVLRSYGDKLNWVSEPDRGQAHAINKGLAQSTGQILSYLNSDDTLTPDAVETVVKRFRAQPDVMIYGDADYIDVEDKITGAYPTEQFSSRRLLENCFICQPAAFWSAYAARKIGPFDESLQYVMDYDYWLRMAMAGVPILHVPVKLANSRLYPETKTLSSRSQIYREIFKVCLRHGGHVDESWIRGFVHETLHSEGNWLFRGAAVVLPTLERNLVDFYSYRFGQAQQSPIAALGKVMRKKANKKLSTLSKRMKPFGLWFSRRKDQQEMPAGGVAAPSLTQPANASPVVGFMANGHLKAQSRFVSEATKSRQPLRLAGWPTKDARIDIRSGGQLILSATLQAERPTTFEFVPLADDVTIRFEPAGATKRSSKIAFCVTDTNLFSENEFNVARRNKTSD